MLAKIMYMMKTDDGADNRNATLVKSVMESIRGVSASAEIDGLGVLFGW